MTAPLLVGLAVVVLGIASGPVVGPVPRTPRRRAQTGERWRGRSPVATWSGRLMRWAATRRRQRRGVAPDDVASWCDALSRRLRSGSTLRESLQTVVPDDELLVELTEPIRRRLERGASIPDAFGDDATTSSAAGGATHVEAVRAVVLAVAAAGGSAAAPLDRTAAALRLRHADLGERSAHAAQAKMSARVLTAVPVGALALLVTFEPSVRHAATSRLGAAVVVGGLTLNATGAWWMRRIVDGAA